MEFVLRGQSVPAFGTCAHKWLELEVTMEMFNHEMTQKQKCVTVKRVTLMRKDPMQKCFSECAFP